MEVKYPLVFIFLIVLGFILFLGKKRTSISSMLNIQSDHLKDRLYGNIDINKINWKKRCRIVGLLFLIISASGIQVGTKVKPVERKGVDLIFTVDVSISMNAEDVKPSRLEKAKFEISQIIHQLKGDRVGIIVFAGASHLYLPLTADYEAAILFLDEIDTEMIPTQGTDISSALNTGLSTFSDKSEKYKVLILITDGEDHEGKAIAIAEKAAQTGIVIHAVGVGSVSGSLIPVIDKNTGNTSYKKDRNGKLITSVLNEGILQDIARAGNGIYVRFDNRAAHYKVITDSIKQMEKKTISTHEFSEYEDQYQIFGVIAFTFLLASFFIPTKKTTSSNIEI
ncbi:MAG: VWA domain-containing protein [Candidatus Marinimicrobia bacterium]|nr:VWA domain-containing protein [Candidatus Neomarinimicrobiota bacterium]